MENYYLKHKQKIHNALMLCLGILLCILFFRYIFPILLPFVLGWLLSLLFCPLTDFLERHHIPRGIGAALCVLLLLGVFALLGYFAGSQLRPQLMSLVDAMPYYLGKIQAGLTSMWSKVDALVVGLPDVITNAVAYVQQEFFSILLSLIQSSGSASAIAAVPKALLGCIIMLFSAYFFTKDAALIRQMYERHAAPLLKSSVEATKKDLANSIWGYVKTQLILMVYVFLISLIGLYILHSPYALLLSICIALIDAVPFFGSGFILWPGAALHFIMGNTPLAIGYLVIYGVVQLVRQLMQPKILGTQIGMHPLLTLFSMYLGYRTLGFWGLILGPILAVVLRTLLRVQQEKRTEL